MTLWHERSVHIIARYGKAYGETLAFFSK